MKFKGKDNKKLKPLNEIANVKINGEDNSKDEHGGIRNGKILYEQQIYSRYITDI